MEAGTLSLGIASVVALVQLLNYFNARTLRKEAGIEKFARAESVASEFVTIKSAIKDIEDKVEDQSSKISNLQVQAAVSSSQTTAQLREMDKLGDKIDELRNGE